MSNALAKINTGSVQIRGETVDLNECQELISDVCRLEEDVVTADYLKVKYSVSDDDLANLATSPDLERAVILEKQRRVDNGRATSEKAARLHHEQGPAVLYSIMSDKMERAAARIAAEERLAKLKVGSGPDGLGYQGPTFQINIITSNSSSGTKTITVAPSKPPLPAPAETSLQPITIISRDHDPDDAGSEVALSEEGTHKRQNPPGCVTQRAWD
jgi:hypothetical protein